VAEPRYDVGGHGPPNIFYVYNLLYIFKYTFLKINIFHIFYILKNYILMYKIYFLLHTFTF